MACGCATRMRKYVLPHFGYTLCNDVWQRPGSQDIFNSEIADHYSQVAAKLVAEFGMEKCRQLARRLHRQLHQAEKE